MEKFEIEYEKIKEKWAKCGPIKKIEERVKSLSNQPFILYGAGRLSEVFLAICKEINIEVVAICDKRICQKEEYDIPIISPAELCNKYSDAVILVCSYSYNDEICDNLKKYGFTDSQIIPYPAEYSYFETPQSFEKYILGYSWAYSFFEDELSRKLVLDRIRLCLLDEGLVPNTTSDCYYEDGIINLGKHEVFIDGGAYIGDTAEEFIKKTNGNYSHIYSFEPSNANYKQAISNLSKYSNVDVIQKGLWSSETILSFSENVNNLAGSNFSNVSNENTLPVISLDYLFSQKNSIEDLPTFIKMDIEGSEKEALLGAKNIIRKKKPLLAICAYHKIEDIYELPKTILSIRDDYRFALRQYTNGGYDTVLYAF